MTKNTDKTTPSPREEIEKEKEEGTEKTTIPPKGEDFTETEQHECLQSLTNLVEEATKVPIGTIAPQEARKVWHSPTELNTFIKQFGEQMGISELLAVIGIALLFLKGAANKGTPNSLSVCLYEDKNSSLEITKADMLYLYKKTYKNEFIRRLAESLCIEISNYAEKQGLHGDLAKKVNILLAKNQEPPLSRIEAAWCSSFCQGCPKLATKSNRLNSLLAEDYTSRFRKTVSTNPTPKKGGPKEKATKNKTTEGKNKTTEGKPKL